MISALKRMNRWRMKRFPLTDFERAFASVEPHALMGLRALARLYSGTREVVREGIEGDIVECGVARGGSAGLLARALRDAGSDKRMWLYDNFEGMPEPDPKRDPDYEAARKYVGACKGDEVQVRELVTGLRGPGEIQIVKGLFQDTLPFRAPQRIALLHLDCDWYQSVRFCLDTLYDRMEPGGILQLDDYHFWEGCRKAVDEFFLNRKIEPRLVTIDASSVWMRIPAAHSSSAK